MDQSSHTSSAHHNLPRLPSVHSNNPRMAVSKCSVKQSDHNGQLNIVSNTELAGAEKDDEQLGTSTEQVRATTRQSGGMPPPHELPTPPTSGGISDESPQTPKVVSPSSGSRSPSVSPPMAARKDLRGVASVDQSDVNKSQPERARNVECSGLSPFSAVGQRGQESSGSLRRTKTKGQIKKQLQKKRGQKTDATTDSGSGASTPRSEAQVTR